MVKLNQRFRKSPQTLFRVVDKDVILLNTETNFYYVLEKVGAIIWGWIEAGKSVKEMIDGIYDRYEVSKRDSVKEDVLELINDLIKEGLVACNEK
ncbi:MAG: PqqD family protein [bacterium]|nr:PqqD family protein [bacterium]